ncbi:MAG: ATP-binding protein, partial [Myxococcota bacterium]
IVGYHLGHVVPSIQSYWKAHQRDPSERGRFEVGADRPDGSRIRLGFSFAPLAVDAGESSAMVVFQDLTDIVRLKEAVERAERLATVGKFAAGLAHEVRNPLASMCASIDVLKESIDPPPAMKRLMNNVVREADRLNALITDFLAFARPRPLRAEPVELASMLRSIMSVFSHDQLLAHTSVQWQVTPGIRAMIDSDLIRQVIWNLVRNAAEATPQGQITLICRKEGDKPVVRIRDDGPGIPPEQLAKIFDPFYTTKEGGTGLGLAIAHSIIEAHGGELNVDSELGQGTEISLLLPEAAASPTAVAMVKES